MSSASGIHERVLRFRRQRVEPSSPHRLAREIAYTLAIKGVLLYGIWMASFSHPGIDSMIDGMDPDQVGAAITASAPLDTTANSLQERPQ